METNIATEIHSSENMKIESGVMKNMDKGASKDRGKLMIIGVGGAGYNMASTIRREATAEAFRNAKYVFADKKEPESVPIVEERDGCIHLNLLHIDLDNDVPSDFFQDIEEVYIVAGMGGDTGSKWASIISKFVRWKSNKTVTAIVSEPFIFEGMKKEAKAYKGIAEIADSNVDTLISLRCEDLIDCYCGNITFFNAFLYVDKAILTIIEEIYHTTNVSAEIVVCADRSWMRYRFTQGIR